MAIEYLKLYNDYSISKLMTFPECRKFLNRTRPNDPKTFKDNILNFLEYKYGTYLCSNNQEYLDNISSLLKLFRQGHSIPLDKYSFLQSLISEKKTKKIIPLDSIR